MANLTKRRVGVLFGGRSAEHEVSLSSAKAVMAAIDPNQFDVVAIGITPSGHWRVFDDRALIADLATVPDADGREVSLLPKPADQALLELEQSAPLPKLDVIIPLVHGTYGEDGTLQGLFELACIPYVGSGVLGSAVAMDKGAMKALLAGANLPVADYQLFSRHEWISNRDSVLDQCAQRLGFPVFVKPANLGSSVGISKAVDRSQLHQAMDFAARYDRRLLVEQAIENAHEVEVSVLGNDEPRVSVIGEIIPANEFYDYEAKYGDVDSQLIIPAPLPEAVSEQVRAYALTAFKALDCAGLARIDFLVRRGSYEIYLLEANTLPGFTPISMYPKLWEASGLAYSDLITTLIELAIERFQDCQQNVTCYDA